MPTPQDCTTKEDVRAEIDRLDRELISLLSERFSFVRRVAELKLNPGEARDHARVDAVLDKVAAEAEAAGVDPDLIRSMWRLLIDWNIAWESEHIGQDDDG